MLFCVSSCTPGRNAVCWRRGLLEPLRALWGEHVCHVSAGPMGLAGKAQSNPTAASAVKLTIWERCWHSLTCLFRGPCVVSYLMEHGAGLTTYLTTGLRTDTVSFSLGMGELEKLKEKICLCSKLGISQLSNMERMCVSGFEHIWS